MAYLFNKRVKIERLVGVDDDNGGFSPTGTFVVSEVQSARLDQYMPSQWQIRNYGLETEVTFTLILHYGRQNPIHIIENDIVTLIFPPHDPEYNHRFRVRGVSNEATHPSDPRGIIECTLTRIRETRSSASI
jgi:hypothetical protein